MNDNKRLIRQLKREVKRAGTRKLRRYLKDLNTEPDDFDYGANCSAAMNEKKVERNSFRSIKATE